MDKHLHGAAAGFVVVVVVVVVDAASSACDLVLDVVELLWNARRKTFPLERHDVARRVRNAHWTNKLTPFTQICIHPSFHPSLALNLWYYSNLLTDPS